MPTPKQKLIHNPIPTSFFVVCLRKHTFRKLLIVPAVSSSNNRHISCCSKYSCEVDLVPVCSYILSESLLCHSTAVEVCLCLVLYCVGDLNPVPALVAQLVEHSCLESGESWVQILPRAALFSLKKGLLWVCWIVCICLAYNLVDDIRKMWWFHDCGGWNSNEKARTW